MSDSEPVAKPVSLEDLIALNDEIASLVRAGVPLEMGMAGLGTSLTGNLSKLTDRLAQQMRNGSSLMEAFESQKEAIPPIYRAVVETGIKAGRLPEALESLTRFAQSVLDLRRRIGLAFMYPGLVLLLAYVMFVVFMIFMVPRLDAAFATLNLPVEDWLSVLNWISQSVPVWGAALPILMMLFYYWWKTTARAMLAPSTASGLSRIGIPGTGRIITNYHLANFAEILSMLVDHEIPLHKAMTLAADSTGDLRIVTGARRIADELQSGKSLAESFPRTSVFPSFMRWMMSNGEKQGTLAAVLRQVTDIYRRRALHQSEWFKLILPIVLVVVVGGGATAVYALTLFLPLSQLLNNLSIG